MMIINQLIKSNNDHHFHYGNGGAPSACAACPRSVSQVRNPGSQRDDDSGSTGRLGMLLDRLDHNKGEWQLARRDRF